MRSRILCLTLSLVFGGVPIAFAQMDSGLSKVTQIASVNSGLQVLSTNRAVNAACFTNHLLWLSPGSAPKREPEPALSCSLPLSEPSAENESGESTFTRRFVLADLKRTASPPSWRIGDGGILSYTTLNARWHLVFRYNPDLSAP